MKKLTQSFPKSFSSFVWFAWEACFWWTWPNILDRRSFGRWSHSGYSKSTHALRQRWNFKTDYQARIRIRWKRPWNIQNSTKCNGWVYRDIERIRTWTRSMETQCRRESYSSAISERQSHRLLEARKIRTCHQAVWKGKHIFVKYHM